MKSSYLLMILGQIFIISLISAKSVKKSATSPSVAFLCGKSSHYYSVEESAWKVDLYQDCFTDLDDILLYCKRIYPNMNITHVLPWSSVIDLPDWCPIGPTNCQERTQHTKHEVRPFKCMSGETQSAYFLVPQLCKFGHRATISNSIHEMEKNDRRNSYDCEMPHLWEKTARDTCKEAGDELKSYGFLFPCSKDVNGKATHYSGVEYVCCPRGHGKQSQSVSTSTDSSVVAVRPHVNNHINNATTKPDSHKPSDIKDFYRYLMAITPLAAHESIWLKDHKLFQRAKMSLHQNYENERNYLQNELTNRIRHMRHLPMSVIREFRHKFCELHAQQMNRLRQIDTSHQERIKERFAWKKRKSLHDLLKALNDMNSKDGKTGKAKIKYTVNAWEGYIRLCHKRRQQLMNHFHHMRVTDPVRAFNERSIVNIYLNAMENELRDLRETIEKASSGEHQEGLIIGFTNILNQYGLFKGVPLKDLPVVEPSPSHRSGCLAEVDHIIRHVTHGRKAIIHHLPIGPHHRCRHHRSHGSTVYMRVQRLREAVQSHVVEIMIAFAIFSISSAAILMLICGRSLFGRYRTGRQRHVLTVLENDSVSPHLLKEKVKLCKEEEENNQNDNETTVMTKNQLNGFANPTYKYSDH